MTALPSIRAWGQHAQPDRFSSLSGCLVAWKGCPDGEVWEINQSIFRSDEQRGAGPYLYLEVGVWDDDSCLENWDMLGIVSTLLTEEDAYGVGVPIIFPDTGYDNGEVTIELEMTEY